MLLTMDEHGPKIDRNSVFDCHLSPVGRQMTIENPVSNDFLSTFVASINVFDCHLSGVNYQFAKYESHPSRNDKGVCVIGQKDRV